MTSKLIKSIQPKDMMEFIELLLFLDVDYIWAIIFYQVIILEIPYEKAGEPFGISKHNIYERLKDINRRLAVND